ncbi:polysaccharide pyruvyl transferase family protein [Bacteroides pyogenes]|uniref:polysaccharide pyruvyl transferase family protein n=1 Tax=Bacteroides pyogenes TaxID=310300 RepID=UPI0011E450B2|nr:polysaccharide pyruvyl transferase family protein [Bacteroides pyogenes]TYK38355.1 polysaccharide pyruvyl transferase family protein [Bacteroides pyogenes]
MKIAILTYPIHSNFGFLMQAYALQLYLKRLGHDPYTIYITPQKPTTINRLKLLIKDFLYTIKGVPGHRLFRYWPSAKQQAIMDQNTWEFIRDNINLTKKQNSFADLYNFDVESYDAYIVGSDQVWRYEYLDQITSFYFDFLPDSKRRMSYAASFGISEFDYSEEDAMKCKALLQKFNFVTVRETDGIRLCKENFGIGAVKVLDPVFLLSKTDYEVLANKGKKLSQKKYLFYYILDPTPQKLAYINKIASENGYEIINIMPGLYHLLGPKYLSELIYPSVYDILSGFCNADYVVTDSFHGTAFSIILNKRFTVFANLKRGNSRLTSILSTFGLEDRIFSSTHNYNNPIDFDEVNKKIKENLYLSESIIKKFLQ